MRELSIIDMNLIGGGLSEADMIAAGTALGGGVGLSLAATWGLTATEGLALAGIGATFGGAITAAAISGWVVGQGLNKYTPIQDWIRNVLDTFQDGDQ